MFTKKDIMKLTAIIYLYEISELQNKSKVVEKLGISSDTIKKYIDYLELEYGVKLLASSGRGSALTPEGEKFIEDISTIHDFLRTKDTFITNKNKPYGTVRLAITEGISLCMLPEGFGEFIQEYPDINIQTTCTDELPNLSFMEVDIVISYDYPQSSDVVAIHVKDMHFRLFAAPEYIKEHGMPKDINDLYLNHSICNKRGLERYLPKWQSIVNNTNRLIYSTNTILGLRNVIRQGIGISIEPVAPNNGLVEISTVNYEEKLPIYMYVHKDSKDYPKNRAFIEFLKNLINKEAQYNGL